MKHAIINEKKFTAAIKVRVGLAKGYSFIFIVVKLELYAAKTSD